MYKMKKSYPKILTHSNIFVDNTFFGSKQFIISKDLNLFNNKCPHRGNAIIKPGTVNSNLKCNLHGWEWDCNGVPKNNNVIMRHKKAIEGKSGLIFLDWIEPIDAIWINDLQKSKFRYSHSLHKIGNGDWRWQMEMHVDLLHVEQIHPLLHSYVDVTKLKTEKGSDWVAQYHENGWWLFIYPFTHIEWEPGCLYFSEMSPRENNIGYDVYIHYFFDDNLLENQKIHFSNLADITFDEDIKAVNEISLSSNYRKPYNCDHFLEQDIVHFYNWLKENEDN